jgi:hypothetical protein
VWSGRLVSGEWCQVFAIKLLSDQGVFSILWSLSTLGVPLDPCYNFSNRILRAEHNHFYAVMFDFLDFTTFFPLQLRPGVEDHQVAGVPAQLLCVF